MDCQLWLPRVNGCNLLDVDVSLRFAGFGDGQDAVVVSGVDIDFVRIVRQGQRSVCRSGIPIGRLCAVVRCIRLIVICLSWTLMSFSGFSPLI